MNTVKVHAAQPFLEKPIKQTVIEIVEPFSDEGFASYEDYAKVFDSEAKILADALCLTLPGGTLDRLAAELLKRAASHFVVASWSTNVNNSTND